MAFAEGGVFEAVQYLWAGLPDYLQLTTPSCFVLGKQLRGRRARLREGTQCCVIEDRNEVVKRAMTSPLLRRSRSKQPYGRTRPPKANKHVSRLQVKLIVTFGG